MNQALKRYWGLAAFAGIVVSATALGVALAEGDQRFGLVLAFILPATCCLTMLTPAPPVVSAQQARWLACAISATAVLAIVPTGAKFLRAPLSYESEVRPGQMIGLPVGTGSVRVEVAGTLPPQKDARVKVRLEAGGQGSEVVLRPIALHLKRGSTTGPRHFSVREPSIEDVRLFVPDGEGVRIAGIDGALEGPLSMKVFAEVVSPYLLATVSAALLLGIGVLQRTVGFARNATVGAGAALGFGCLAYARATPALVAQQTLGAILGGVFLGAGAGAAVRWAIVPRARRPRREPKQ